LGMALESISSLSEPSLVRCRTVTLVIFWPVSVSCICIGPYCVFATAPVTVRAAAAWLLPAAAWLLLGVALLPAAGWDLLADVGAGLLDVAGGADGGAAAAIVAGWLLNVSRAASPAAVPVRVRTARSMELLGRVGRSEVERFAVDAAARHPG